MSTWKVEEFEKPNLKDPIFIEGLPGIGNVGKVVADFIVDELKAKKIYEITSDAFPHSVLVTEDNLVELPKIELFYKKCNGQDFIFMAGDVQPIDESSSYEFSEKVLDIVQGLGVSEIITLGGIGLSEIPKEPKVFCTGNNKEMIKKYADKKINTNLYGVVGPIVGVTGLLLGLAGKRKINAIALLAETYGHPMYLGVKGAREVLKILNDKLNLGVDVDKLEKEIAYIEKQILKRTKELSDVSKGVVKGTQEVNYIG
ncbi:MAG TPA: PAC2 family protein [Candidatus Nanoarchaeia archaeon]|nr:PAC2 family protein [Candidatus Nanoarchaeia archaeon]